MFWRNSSVSGNRSKQNRGNDISAGASSGGEDVLPYKTQTSFIPQFSDGQLQLPTFGKLRVELETAKSKLNEQREYYEGVISDGSKRIAKLESNEVREDGNQFLVVRHPGKTPVIKHCTGDLEEFLRQLIEQDPLVTIDIITHRYYGVGGQWVQDAGEYLHMMSDAGIRIKGE